MSFFTALTGLKGAQTDISTTSNNIANVGSAGFKKSRAEFGDIFSTTPLQTNLTGSGTQQKSITQQFSQGNIQQSTNTLDMAVSGQGFFALKAGGNTGQTVYTRNGAFNLNGDGYIVDSNGQFLLGYPVDSDGAVTDTTLSGAVKLQLQTEYGDPKETNNVSKGVNLPAGAPVIASNVTFDANDPETLERICYFLQNTFGQKIIVPQSMGTGPAIRHRPLFFELNSVNNTIKVKYTTFGYFNNFNTALSVLK